MLALIESLKKIGLEIDVQERSWLKFHIVVVFFATSVLSSL